MAGCLGPAASSAGTITFDSFTNGEIITSANGVGISALNLGDGPDIAAIFDAASGLPSADSDLLQPFSVGNTALNTPLGNMLVIAEHPEETGGILDSPDDEGSRPAGILTLTFPDPITMFGLHLVDIESSTAEAGSLQFFDGGLTPFLTVSFMDIEDPVDPMDPFGNAAIYGNNSINLIQPFAVANATKVEIHLGGSGAVDNIFYAVPEPGTLFLIGLGVAVGGRARRRQR